MCKYTAAREILVHSDSAALFGVDAAVTGRVWSSANPGMIIPSFMLEVIGIRPLTASNLTLSSQV